MMKLRYTVSMEDVLAFNQYFYRHSSTVRRSKLMILIGVPIILMALATYHGIRDHSWGPPITMLILCPILVGFLRWSFERNIKKTTLRIYRERPTKGLIGEHVLGIDDTGVTESTVFGEQLTRWEGVERIVTTDDHAFIFVGAIMAHVVPRATVTEGDFDEFISTSTKKWQAVNPQPTVADERHCRVAV
jgi:hypothetical protein